MRIITDVKLDFDNVLIVPKRSTLTSRIEVDVSRTFVFKHTGQRWTGVPVMASNMDGVGTFSAAKVLQNFNMMTVIKKHYTLEDWIREGKHLDWNYIACCTGTNAIFDQNASDYQLLKEVADRFPLRHICIDVANGYQENFVTFVNRIREEFPDQTLMAGNVVTPEMTEQLILSGADIVKLGIGPGSVCTTRIQTGIGYPQLSAVIECADAAHGLKGLVIADGGCKSSGDIAKAFGGGADYVMLGGMLAFYEECEEEISTDGKIKFYGMSSNAAMNRHGMRKDGYRTPEGKIVDMDCRGPIIAKAQEIIGALSSSCSYVGAQSLKELSRRTTFVKVSSTHNTVFGNSQ